MCIIMVLETVVVSGTTTEAVLSTLCLYYLAVFLSLLPDSITTVQNAFIKEDRCVV